MHILNFLRICFCCEIVEGYGMTETGGMGAVTYIGDYDAAGVVGGPL